ncbi:DEAD/DEAH box helicase [Candidatus Dojkabacteria bacterium]|uniref:DEAD/DEAH box helicase n=1 Tax=Candidatus Dojkabacteria bacterium TaxID=2099670 RepID=A0A955RJ23_9BACT|nr:DEAD/DEAH box helicase [Candidatus Dojkabacteria bacterium]
MSFKDVSKSHKRNNSKRQSNNRSRNRGKRNSQKNNKQNNRNFNNSNKNTNNRSRRFAQKRASVMRDGSIDKSIYISKAVERSTDEQDAYQGIKYTEFDLHKVLADNIEAKGFIETTKIQELTIPLILDKKDVLGISETGSGKTGAFLIPMIDKLLKDSNQKLLVIAPTRELALQIAKEAISFVKDTHLNVSKIIGGDSMHRQLQQIRRGDQIIVGTPGRINDLIRQGYIKIGNYNNIVIDEVDRMLDMGFIADIRFIFDNMTKNRQSLFFSATLNKSVEQIVASLSNSFEVIQLANNTPKDSIEQSVIEISSREEKMELLNGLLLQEEVKKAIIFVDTKRYANKVDRALFEKGFKVGVIHGDKTQNFRKRVIEKFKTSTISILVATNVAARGIDIEDITHVINLDEPQSYDEYIHRIGRTGRNGTSGRAYTFIEVSSN